MVLILFSNSMIEAFWNSLRHNCLYLHDLDSYHVVHKLVSFYYSQHNTVIPHSAFKGQTPYEVFHGLGDHIPAELARFRAEEGLKRMEHNRSLACTDCLSDFSSINDNLIPSTPSDGLFSDDHFP